MTAVRNARGMLLFAVGAAALVGWASTTMHAPQQALASYLAAYIFFLGLALGSMALLMSHALTGGRWGVDLRAALLAAMRALPLLALLLVPLLVGARWLYPWAAAPSPQRAIVAPNLAQQAWYLNQPFFLTRALVCFTFWLLLAAAIQRHLAHRRGSLPAGLAAGGLIVYALTITVAGVDWIMSLLPAWHSSAFGLIVGTSQMLCAGALAIGTTTRLRDAPPPERRRDLGSLLLMLVLAWSYLAFADYLTVWIADLPPETIWYLPRLKTSWHWIGAWLIGFELFVPFAILLSRRAKSSNAWLLGVCVLLLAGQGLYAGWLVLPDLRPTGFALTWSDALAWAGIGALGARTFLAGLK